STCATAGSRESSRLAEKEFRFPLAISILSDRPQRSASPGNPTHLFSVSDISRSSTRFSFPYQTDNKQGQGWPLPVIDECMDRAPAPPSAWDCEPPPPDWTKSSAWESQFVRSYCWRTHFLRLP